jgi:Holliday junction resolvase RusA-like endonuclease
MTGRIAVTMHVYRPRKSGDLDNRTKAVLDCLQGVVYLDDAQIVELHTYRHDDKLNPRVEVTISEVVS